MTRLLTTLVIATLFSSTLFGQGSPFHTTSPNPVADLTSQIISRYMPTTATSSSYAHSYGPQLSHQGLTTGYSWAAVPNQGTVVATPSSLPMAMPMMPRYGSFPSLSIPYGMPWMPFIPYDRQPPRLPAGQWMNATIATPGFALAPVLEPTPRPMGIPAVAMPQMRSFSAASTNGVHAIQALVPTDTGDTKVELNGTTDQIRSQLDTLSPQVQGVMRSRLGL